MAKAYKALKEDFVSNHSGGTISEINYVTAVAPVCAGGSAMWVSLILQDRNFSLVGSSIATEFIYSLWATCILCGLSS